MAAEGPSRTGGDRAAKPGALVGRRELRASEERCLAGLAGLPPASVVALLAHTSSESLAVLLAARTLGLRVLPLDPTYTLEELAYAVNGAAAAALLVTAEHEHTAAMLEPMTPGVERRWVIGSAIAVGAGRITSSAPIGTAHSSTAATGRPVVYPVPDPVEEELGRRDLELLLGGIPLDADSILVSGTAFADPAATQLVTATLLAGGRVACPSLGTIDAAIACARAYGATVLHVTPRQVIELAKGGANRVDGLIDNGLALVLVTVPGCPVDIVHTLGPRTATIFRHAYLGPGAGVVSAISGGDLLSRPRSVGRPIADVVRITAEGIVEVRDRSRPDTWTSWGDHGLIDSDGYLHLSDRDSFLGSAGTFIVPREIETALMAHPLIADVAVAEVVEAGVRRIVAYVETEPGTPHDARTAEQLLAWLHPQVPPHSAPDRVEFLSEVPRSASGKLDRRRLRRHDSLSVGQVG